MSDTPRMDAIWAQNYCSGGDAAGKTWDMIRDLDRELAAAQDEIKRLRGKCAAIEGNEIGYPCVALSEAQAQRDKAREDALEEAAKVCDSEATIEGIAQKCAAAIRALKKECGK